jgi:hypothetical protein
MCARKRPEAAVPTAAQRQPEGWTPPRERTGTSGVLQVPHFNLLPQSISIIQTVGLGKCQCVVTVIESDHVATGILMVRVVVIMALDGRPSWQGHAFCFAFSA